MNTRNIKQFLFIAFCKTIWFNFKYFPFKIALKMPVLIAKKVQIRYCHKGFCSFSGEIKTGILRFGFGNRLFTFDQKSSIFIAGKIMVIGNGVHAFGPGTQLSIKENGILQLGNNFAASFNNKIVCYNSITIGDDNMWSFDNVIMDTDAHQILTPTGTIINNNKPIMFGNHVWLGCRNLVLKGAFIPDGCIIASGSKITGRYELSNSIITSHGKTIKENIVWKGTTAI